MTGVSRSPIGVRVGPGVSVGVTQRIWELDRKDWEWLFGVNVWGVIHGLQAFLPRMMKQASRAHILNTASAAALIAGPVLGPYKASKHAVLSISETLFHDLRDAGSPIGVSVFCPDVVATRLRQADRNRPAHLRRAEAATLSADEQAFSNERQQARGLAPRAAAELAFQASERRGDLPRGPIHADLFRDNVLFADRHVGGVIDFYFAGVDALLFDVAVTLNDWCIEYASGAIEPARAAAFIASYRAGRPFTAQERVAWPVMLRAAALRFWLSRLHDFYLPRPGELIHAHDPEHFHRILALRVSGAGIPAL